MLNHIHDTIQSTTESNINIDKILTPLLLYNLQQFSQKRDIHVAQSLTTLTNYTKTH